MTNKYVSDAVVE